MSKTCPGTAARARETTEHHLAVGWSLRSPPLRMHLACEDIKPLEQSWTNKHLLLMVFNHFIIFDGFWFLVFESVGFKGQRTGRFLPFFLGWFFSRQNIHSVSTPAASLSELGRKLLLSARRGKSDSLWSLPFFLGRVLLESYWSV